jgi:hypothetical protein
MQFDALKPGTARQAHRGSHDDPRSGGYLSPRIAQLATVFAFGLALVGWTDLALLWFPLQTSSPEWEFGAITAFFESMPLGTIGLVCLALVSALQRRVRSLRFLTILFWVLALGFVALLGVFVLGVPLALRAVQGPMQPVLQFSLAKTAAFGLIYVMMYAWFGRLCSLIARDG